MSTGLIQQDEPRFFEAFRHAERLIVEVVKGEHRICIFAVVVGVAEFIRNLRLSEMIVLGFGVIYNIDLCK